MTTPTIEQVVQWQDTADAKADKNIDDTDFNAWNLYRDMEFATLARADLEATIVELKSSKRRRGQIERITQLEADIAEQAKAIEQLKISADEDRKVYVLSYNYMRQQLQASQASQAREVSNTE